MVAFLIAIFGGMVSGILAAIIAKEELKAGKKYFRILSFVFLIGVLVAVGYALMYNDYVLLLSFIFLLGIPVGSLAAIRFPNILRLV